MDLGPCVGKSDVVVGMNDIGCDEDDCCCWCIRDESRGGDGEGEGCWNEVLVVLVNDLFGPAKSEVIVFVIEEDCCCCCDWNGEKGNVPGMTDRFPGVKCGGLLYDNDLFCSMYCSKKLLLLASNEVF